MAHFNTIEATELKRRLDEGEDLRLVETLTPEQFQEGHLPGAINIPTDQIEEQAPVQLYKGDPIVVYCASSDCSASPKAARKLVDMGYTHVTDFEAGKAGWREAGFELVS